jgi:hypothetical protein
MEEIIPVIAPDENGAGEVTPEITPTPVATATTQEEDKYKKELDRLTAMNLQKEGALKEERRLRREAQAKLDAKAVEPLDDEPKVKYLTQVEMDAALDKRMAKQKFEDKLETVSNNVEEQKLVRYHYENSIVRTGDVATDLKMAIAIANQHLVEQVKKAEADREENEFINAKVSGGGTYNRASGKGTTTNDRAAAQFLKNIGAADAEKFLGK